MTPQSVPSTIIYQHPSRHPLTSWKNAIAILVAFALAIGSASAQTLQFRFSFEDSGTNVTSGPDGALGTSIVLNMLNFGGTATDFHGGAASGVQETGQSLNFSSAVNAGTAANSTINGPIAQTLNNAAFAPLGTISSFTATLWIKQFTSITNTQNRGPRLLLFGPGITDNNGTANDISLYFQNTNAIYFKYNNSIISAPIYYNPLPTNVWLFIAIAYDGTNNASIYMGSEASPAKLLAVRSIGAQTVNFGASANLLIGNRSTDRARGFSGWFDEMRFYTGIGDSNFVENIRQMSTPVVVSSLYPDGSTLMEGTNQLIFTVASTNGTPTNGVTVLVNGTNVSSSLVFGGSSTNLTVSYTGLPVNGVLSQTAPLNAANISIKIVDNAGILTTNSITYDTFSPTNFTWEGEDYDFNGGQFIDNPIYQFTTATNSYWQTSGTAGIDYNDAGGGAHVYRSSFDLVATEFSVGTGANGGNSVGELMRQKILDAFALDPTIRDVDMGNFDGPGANPGLPNWVNYTRTYPAGAFNVYTRAAFGATSGSATLSQVTNGWGTGSQSLLPLGTFTLANSGGWESYEWVPLRDASGNLVRVNLNGSTNTFQFTAGAGGGGNHNFLMLSPANTNVPVITGIYPNGTNMFQFSTNLSFVASSPAGVSIGANSINVQLQGATILTTFVTNITAANGLLVTGPATNRSVSCPLASNTTYTAVITVTDANGNPASSTVKFDTYNPTYTWEAEDYNHDSGQFIDNPETNAYAGLGAADQVDTSAPNFSANTGAQLYRPSGLNTEVNGDVPRLAYINSGLTDYDVGFNNSGNWGNYTRTFPSGTFNIYMRGANGSTAGGLATMAIVNGDITGTNQTPVNLGTFSVPVTGNWQAYTWIPLRDNNGNLAQFTGGGVKTLRVTSGSGYNANFYALFQANTNLPVLSNVLPAGTNMFESTNTLSFTAASSAGISAGSISVVLNGVDISSSVTVGGTANNRTVTYPHLQPNMNYTVAITVRDGNGNPASTTLKFDTFSAANYTWEGEDYDHDGGQFIDNPQTNLYAGLNAMTDVDTHQVNFAGTLLYRPSGMDTEINGDVPRAQYSGTGLNDYTAGFFSDGAWMNYTRNYPAGTYYVYGRMATGGASDSSVTLSEITSGWGTTNQTVQDFGTFSVPLTAWESYTFVPLRDTNGNLVPVTFNGSTNTLRVSRPTPTPAIPDVNVNFLMLVPPFMAHATVNGANLNISFATQSGFKYQVQFKNNLTDATWTSLGSPVTGDGTVKTVTDALATSRFYRVAIQ